MYCQPFCKGHEKEGDVEKQGQVELSTLQKLYKIITLVKKASHGIHQYWGMEWFKIQATILVCLERFYFYQEMWKEP